MRQLWFVVALGGCATATTPNEGTPDAPGGRIDSPGQQIDAPGQQIDAPPQCTMMTSNLLVNGAFEMTATGWMETRVDNQAIVRADGPIAANTPTFKAWLGGVLGDVPTPPAVDALWQDVVVPAGTTMLRVTGMYDVRTTETGATAFDTGSLSLVTTANAPIETIVTVSNLTPKTAWTAIDHMVTAPVAGMTVRLRMTSSNDFLNASNFYFDSLGLMATSCAP